MIAHIVRLSLRHRFIVFYTTALLVALGLLSGRRLPSDLLPDLSSPIVTVLVENPSLAPQEVEALITRPLEGALRGLPRVITTRSTSVPGLATVVVEFEWGTDYARAVQQIAGQLGSVAAAFPPGTRPPTIASATSRLGQVVEYYLRDTTRDPVGRASGIATGGTAPDTAGRAARLRRLHDLAEYDVRYAVLGTPGVLKVTTMGGAQREYEVAVHAARLAAAGFTLSDVVRAVADANVSFSGGIVREGPTEYAVRGVGRLDRLADLRQVTLGTRNGIPVPLAQVADIVVGSAPRRGIASLDGTDEEIVTGTVSKQFGTSSHEVVGRVMATLRDVRAFLPRGVVLKTFFSEAELIDVAIRNLQEALLIGAVSVIIVIFLVLWNARATLVIGTIIPLAVILAFIPMRLAGVGLNTMSLGGIAVGLGIMIDAAIVDTENIVRHLRLAPHDPLEATVRGTLEVRRPVTAATLIIIAVFVPLFFLQGMAGAIFAPFGFTVIATMVSGYLLSLTVTPVLAYTVLRRSALRGPAEGPLVRWIERRYRPLLGAAMRRPWPVVGGAVALFGVALATIPLVGADFLPAWDEGALLIKVLTPPGTALDETDRIARAVARAARTAPDVEEVIVRSGRAEASEDVEGVNNVEMLVRLVPFDRRTRDAAAVKRAVRERIHGVPGARVSVTSPLVERIDEMLAGSSGQLAITVFGDDLATLAGAAQRVADVLATTPGVVDVTPEPTVGIPQLVVTIDRGAAAAYGITPEEIATETEIAFAGRTATTIVRGQRKAYDVVVRLTPEERLALSAVSELPVAGSGTVRVPLAAVARVRLDEGPAQIRRENGRRRIQVTANLAGRDVGSVVRELRPRLAALHLPPGYYLELGGNYRSQQAVTHELTIAFLAAVAVIFLLLAVAFQSIRRALLVLATIPLALTGGIFALLITGLSFNVSSGIGLLAHFGLAVQKAVILVDYADDLRRAGATPTEAAQRAAEIRLRPVLMTALAASLAVLPLALGYGAGAEMQQPLAVVLIGGLVTSTLLTLLVIPALYPRLTR